MDTDKDMAMDTDKSKFFMDKIVQELWGRDAAPVFGATMSYNRFAYLLSHLRLDRITERAEARLHDKFAPARYSSVQNYTRYFIYCKYGEIRIWRLEFRVGAKVVPKIELINNSSRYKNNCIIFVSIIFREVFELFNDACSRALQCGPEICIDETLYKNRQLCISALLLSEQ